MEQEKAIKLYDTQVWRDFKKDFLKRQGIAMLALGMPGTGKTQKIYQVEKWILEFTDETIVHIDSGKSDEIGPLFDMGRPVRVIIPKGCKMEISHPSCDIEIVIAKSPKHVWKLIDPHKINIVSIRQFFYRIQGYARYISNLFEALLTASYEKSLPGKICVVCDEFANVCPGYDLQISKAMKTAAIKIAFALKNLRSNGVRVIAADQQWTDVFPPARKEFSFFLICRSPGIPAGVEVLGDYRAAFRKLPVEHGMMIFPQFNWDGIWEFVLFKNHKDLKIVSSGKAVYKFNAMVDDEGEEGSGEYIPISEFQGRAQEA